jgi:hypothetical protein
MKPNTGKAPKPPVTAVDKTAKPEMAKFYNEVLNIDPDASGNWRGMKVVNLGSNTPNVGILETISSPGQGTLIVKQSNKDADINNPKASQTDMFDATWLADNKGAGTDPKGLKLIIRDNIVAVPTKDSNGIDLNTVTAIDEVFTKLNTPKDQVLRLDAQSTDPNIKASYELMSAQTHVARPLQWFTDRHQSLGDPKIETLVITTNQHPIGQYQIAIILTR